ncbi:hypothetical protein RBH58_26735 [Escherichia coli]|uniref:hypothetical protein n=1 Tax=Escherichia coli TaxID=562 RepID=UPI0018318506|nr:hypothetical protein [Escherichia coli]EHU3918981.1 hypothetical protein [Escherichia coli]ELT4259949.1 hypothetical protein [Escherichia coli]
MAESGYGLAGLGMGKVKSINQYRLTPGFGGFTPVSHVTTACRLPCRWRGISICWWLCLKGYIGGPPGIRKINHVKTIF